MLPRPFSRSARYRSETFEAVANVRRVMPPARAKVANPQAEPLQQAVRIAQMYSDSSPSSAPCSSAENEIYIQCACRLPEKLYSIMHLSPGIWQ